jgi:hypothetical protein
MNQFEEDFCERIAILRRLTLPHVPAQTSTTHSLDRILAIAHDIQRWSSALGSAAQVVGAIFDQDPLQEAPPERPGAPRKTSASYVT